MTDTFDDASRNADNPPREFNGLRDLILERRGQLPKRLAQVASFAMESPDEIAFGTAAGIAEKASVQPSTLVRFAQAFGYQGFSELQSVFRDRLRDRVATYEERLKSLRSGSDSTRAEVIFSGFSSAAIKSLESFNRHIDVDVLEAAVATLAQAETIYLIAQRRSYPVTAYMSYAFGKLGIKTVLIGSSIGIDPEVLSFATPRDAAVAISFTPYASATLTHARAIAARGTPLVVITDSPFSPLVAASGTWFEVVEADYAGFRSLAATMALAMTLTVAVAESRVDSSE